MASLNSFSNMSNGATSAATSQTLSSKGSRANMASGTAQGQWSVMTASPSTPALSSTSPTNTSMQSSPEGLHGRNPPSLSTATPLQLPESTISTPVPPSFQSAMSEAMQQAKTPGLMRRLSGKATGVGRRLKQRKSSNNVTTRDHSSGPVILRRRSGSKTGYENEATSYDGMPSHDDSDIYTEPSPLLNQAITNMSISSGDTLMPPKKPCYDEAFSAPTIPGILQRGTTLQKVTKRNKRKDVRFMLDPLNAKVFWDSTSSSNPSKRLCIDDIQNIYLQKDARNYREEFQMPEDTESTWFTIIYADRDRAKAGGTKILHLIAPDRDIFEKWTSTLEGISRYRHQLSAGMAGPSQDERILREQWNQEMTKLFGKKAHSAAEEYLDLATVEKMCSFNQINCSKNMIREKFKSADSCGQGKLYFEDFKLFIQKVKSREDIAAIFQKYAAGGSSEGLDFPHFLAFLEDVQGVNVGADPAQWVDVFAKFASQSAISSFDGQARTFPPQMNIGAFTGFLSSTMNRVGRRRAQEVKFDHPLNEYFISSSHNTYLQGNQVFGISNVQMYERALERGCRCLEIDCWDGPHGKPLVNHGRTMSSPVSFADCVRVIGQYAFKASSYPLILSLEVHCSREQQKVMVDIMFSTLGDALVRQPINDDQVLPSPQELRNRILIKVKAPDTTIDMGLGQDPSGSSGRRKRSFSSPFTTAIQWDNASIPPLPLSSTPSFASADDSSSAMQGSIVPRGSMTTVQASSASDDSDTPMSPTALRPQKPQKRRRDKIIQELGELGVYTRGRKFSDFDNRGSKTYNHIFSLNENKFSEVVRNGDEERQKLINHNSGWLMRVYPGPTRIKSSNFNPLACWKFGVQMVALNWQTYDQGMQINDAMFGSGHDRSGYVLKPEELRPSTTVFKKAKSAKVQKKQLNFSVDLISAQSLPRPRNTSIDFLPNPYVEIEMFSADNDGHEHAVGDGGQGIPPPRKMSHAGGGSFPKRSTIVQSNGYNPIFNDSFKLSLETKYPSLVFVRWTVWNSPDGKNYVKDRDAKPQASFTAKLSTLETGYRHLPLFDNSGDQYLFSTLFCRVMKEEPVDTEYDTPSPPKRGESLRRRIIKKASFFNNDRRASRDTH